MAKKPHERFASAAEFADAALEASGSHGWPTNTSTALISPNVAHASSRSANVQYRNDTVPAPAGPATLPVPASSPPPRPRGQLALLVTVLALLAIAGATVVAMALNSFGGNGDDPGTNVVPSVPVTVSAEPSATGSPARTTHSTRGPTRPGGAPPRTTASVAPSISTTPTNGTSTEPEPTVEPTATKTDDPLPTTDPVVPTTPPPTNAAVRPTA